MNAWDSIFWFRQDLRLIDNPGLLEAARLGRVLPIYILDDLASAPFHMGGASKVYLYYSLQSLNASLGGALNVYRGDPKDILLQLSNQHDMTPIFWNRCYEPWYARCDEIIAKNLDDLSIPYKIFDASYLWQPKEILKDDGLYYKVFSAYKRKAYSIAPRKPLAAPENLVCIKDDHNHTSLEHLGLMSHHHWEQKILTHWTFGEQAAQNKLAHFIQHGLLGYKKGRDYPGKEHTSKLSVNLHFGEISPHSIWYAIHTIGKAHGQNEDIEHFLSEIVWREFSCYLLTHFSELPSCNFQSKFDAFPWQSHDDLFSAWKKGATGYPFIDAGMRELWQTGYMHNRVRMAVASFLIKNLMIHWHCGRDWFWDCLIDADLANNSASWQWVAGSGADAAPYFRIFNPITQGEKFDANGDYTKTFVPELKNMPLEYLFKPWEAPTHILKDAQVVLGVDYPLPIVDLKRSRENALVAFESLTASEIIAPPQCMKQKYV